MYIIDLSYTSSNARTFLRVFFLKMFYKEHWKISCKIVLYIDFIHLLGNF